MRKRYKLKKRSCALCKPHKMHWEKRWKIKEQDKISRDEREIKEAKNAHVAQR